MQILAITMLILLCPVFSSFAKSDIADKSIALVVKFAGEKTLRSRIRSIAENIEISAKEVGSASNVAYWNNEARIEILKLLKSEGYYDTTLETIVHEISPKNNVIEIIVTTNTRYKFAAIDLLHEVGSNNSVQLPELKKLKSKPGQYAIASKIIEDQEYIIETLEKNNCLLNLNIRHEAVLNKYDNTVSVTFFVEAGQQAKVKEVKFRGNETVSTQYLTKVTGLKPGTCFQRTKMLEIKEAMQRTGLFSSTKYSVMDKPDANSEVPVEFKVKERKHRSVKAGLSYGTDLGAGVNLGWEHRNFFSNGEEVNVGSFVNKKEQLGNISYTKPYFMRDDQKLKSSILYENTRHTAYDNQGSKFFTGIERVVNETVTLNFGGKLSVSKIKETGVSRTDFMLVSVPTSLSYDKRDNILNAHKGYLLRAEMEPFWDTKFKDRTFIKNTFSGRIYTKLPFHKKSLIALRGTTGIIFEKNTSKIPANERYFVGGGSSIRGYAFQMAGPLDENKHPVGGKSFYETSIEYRYMKDNGLGIITFVDSGMVFERSRPSFGKKPFKGAGFGLRYETDFGPIRADIAFPLDRRKKVDKAFQLYFGIGQSF